MQVQTIGRRMRLPYNFPIQHSLPHLLTSICHLPHTLSGREDLERDVTHPVDLIGGQADRFNDDLR